jgi:hypothetical protein
MVYLMTMSVCALNMIDDRWMTINKEHYWCFLNIHTSKAVYGTIYTKTLSHESKMLNSDWDVMLTELFVIEPRSKKGIKCGEFS